MQYTYAYANLYAYSLGMNLTKVHLFVLLLLALVLCSFLGGSCGNAGLEGFNMPSDNSQYSNYSDLYSANKQFAKGQDALYDRKDKLAASHHASSNQHDDDADDASKYAPFSASGADAGKVNVGKAHADAGIPASQIIPGQEDLYILKSSIVPPVCPACPSVKCNANNKNNTPAKCPPCPPCARCPEPSFECKKVPNYNMSDNRALPRPVLNSFSQFGL